MDFFKNSHQHISINKHEQQLNHPFRMDLMLLVSYRKPKCESYNSFSENHLIYICTRLLSTFNALEIELIEIIAMHDFTNYEVIFCGFVSENFIKTETKPISK